MADGVNYSLKGFDQYEIVLGDELRGERATIGKSLLDVQRDLKIKASYIAAIENADLEVFSNPGFIAGYVRSYARYLGLDPIRVYERFCGESGFSNSETVFSLDRKNSSREVPRYFGSKSNWQPGTIGQVENKTNTFVNFIASSAPALVVISVLLGTCFGAFSVLREIQKLDVVALDELPEIFTDFPNSLEDSTLQEYGTDIYSSEELALPVFEPRDRALSTLKPNLLTALEDKKALSPLRYRVNDEWFDGSEQEDSFQVSDFSVLKPSSPVLRTTPKIPKVQLLAMTPAWVRIKNNDGAVIFEKILKQRETYFIEKDLFKGVLRAGNAQNVYFVIDEKVFGPLSADKSVVKNVSLDPEVIQSNFIVAKSLNGNSLLEDQNMAFMNTAGVSD